MANSIQVDDKTRDRLVDVFLEHKGTPRDHLFEYPYNEYESKEILKSADEAVSKTLKILYSAFK